MGTKSNSKCIDAKIILNRFIHIWIWLSIFFCSWFEFVFFFFKKMNWIDPLIFHLKNIDIFLLWAFHVIEKCCVRIYGAHDRKWCPFLFFLFCLLTNRMLRIEIEYDDYGANKKRSNQTYIHSKYKHFFFFFWPQFK